MIKSNILKPNANCYEVRFASIIASSDVTFLTNFYLPLIGTSAFALYFSFYQSGLNNDFVEDETFDALAAKLNISLNELEVALHHLEGVGLVKTLKKELNETSTSFVIILKQPKDPKSFFDDVILSGTLKKILGVKEMNRLINIYVKRKNPNDYKDISLSFEEVYNPDFDDKTYFSVQKAKNNTLGRNVSKLPISFSLPILKEKLFALLPNLKPNSISDEEFDEVARIAALYGIEEEDCAEHLASSIILTNKPGEMINFEQFNDDLKWDVSHLPTQVRRSKKQKMNYFSSGEIGAKIRLFESVAPGQFLSYKQNGTAPVESDLMLIDELSKNLHLVPSVINALIDYCLERNDNVLARNYVMKIGSTLAREEVDNALDAMNYLYKIDKKVRGKNKKNASKQEKIVEEITKSDSEENIEEEKSLDELLKMIDEG